ncbi:hypothetical protein [Streptomyces sp. NPDC088755]|uniref:hypothetical protein n=1 Tax=Streptomyces sp. NPDC088755 TaxID=3365888 RepID=UPI0037FE496A
MSTVNSMMEVLQESAAFRAWALAAMLVVGVVAVVLVEWFRAGRCRASKGAEENAGCHTGRIHG